MSEPAPAPQNGPQHGLTAIVAMASGGVIGRGGQLPWRLGTDLRRFKKLTLGGTLIMGRRTYESIGRPLPGRQTIVITRNNSWSVPGTLRARSPDEAVCMATGGRLEEAGSVFVIGGAEIYRQLLPRCVNLYLTRVLAAIEGDTTLALDLSDFTVVERIQNPSSSRDEFPTEFLTLVRVAKQADAELAKHGLEK